MAAKEGDSTTAAAALERLCRTYWRPLYAYIRRDGQNETEAQDLTQEFFARLLARDYLQHAQHQNGKFRSFPLAYLKPREPGAQSYAQLGEGFEMTESAVRSAVQRMRQRHRQLLRE